MSTKSTIDKPRRWDDQQGSDGSSFANHGQHDHLNEYDHNPGARQREIGGLEAAFARPSAPERVYGNPGSVREQETAPAVLSHRKTLTPKQRENRSFNQRVLKGLFKSKKLRRRSALATLLLSLLGGGSILAIFFSPSLAVIQMKEVLTENLNDQLHTIDERSAMLLRSKLKDVTKGSCGAIKIQCRFATITDKQVEKFKAAGIEVKTVPKEERRWFNGNRGQILEISHTDAQGKKVTATTGEELHKLMLSADNASLRASMIKGFNPLFASVSDKVALSVMKRLKVSKAVVVNGETDEENRKKVDAAVSGVESGPGKTISIQRDEDGNERYIDSDGIERTKEEYDNAQEQSKRIAEYGQNGGTSTVLKNAVKGASIVGYMDVACTVYNSFRMVSGLAKVHKEAQAARYAMAMVLTSADATKAGDMSENGINYVGNTLMSARPSSDVLDSTQLSTPGSAAAPATVTDPEAGMNAMDGPGYRMAAYGEAPDLSLRASQFMIGGGSVALLDGVLKGVAFLVNGGDPNPQGVSEKCGYIQNPVVRFTGLAIGIAAGVGTFGLTTVLSIGGSTAVALALPFLESQAASMLAGDVFKGIGNVDAGDAAVVGTVALFGSIAKTRGLKPLSADEGMKYAVASQKSRSRYVESQQFLARATPFDITNQYSFLGSLARTATPIAMKSRSSASTAMMSLANIIPTAFASLTKPVGAAGRTLDPDYYKKCNDIGYQQLGLGADAFCGIHYGISEDDLTIEPSVIVDYMAQNGEIDPDSETGDAKDNGRAWNYVKWMKECPNRTVGWGENQDENQGNGWNCIDPAKENQNKYYRLYTIDKSVDAAMDGEPVASSGNDSTVDNDTMSDIGWVFPTISDATITSGFKTNSRPDHNGVDIGNAAILGQPVYAARDGKITKVGDDSKIGNWVAIEHTVDNKLISTIYGNLQKGSIVVREGDNVKAGQQIAKVGRGNEGESAHLHFEMWDGVADVAGGAGRAIDPVLTLEAVRRTNALEGARNV